MLVVFFLFYGLGSYPILDNNEGLYAEIPREMLASGDWHHWIIPHLNGLVYMEKPPLLYWLTAISFVIFGEHEWAARLVPVLSASSCIGMMLWFGREIGRPVAARLAALMFVSGLGVMAMSRTLMFDMLLTVFLSGALMFGYLFSMSNSRRYLCWSFGLLGFALLAKGFVAMILFVAVTLAYTLLLSASRQDFFGRCKAWFDGRAILVFLLIVLPWHIAATVTEPIFAWFYFINEHVLRFLGKREPHDYYAGAWWYYLPRMALYLFPWSLFLPVLLFVKSKQATPKSLQFFLACAWIVPVLFFSLSSAKANYYLVVVMPLAAMQLALALEDRNAGAAWGKVIVGLVLSVLFGFLAWWVGKHATVEIKSLLLFGVDAQRFLTVFLLALCILSFVIAVFVWQKPLVGILPYMMIPASILIVSIEIAQASSERISTQALAQDLRSMGNGREIFLYKVFEHQSSLPFYLKQPIRVVDSRSSDLFWGNKLHRNDIVISDNVFNRITEQKMVSLVVLDEDLPNFNEKKYAARFQSSKKIGRSTVFMN